MARPQKVGVEYFPLDVDIDQDDKIAMVEALHGIEGFGIAIKLLMKVYKEGYYYEWTEKEQILFSKRVNVDINEVNVIINDCVKWGLFNKKLFTEYRILTSKGIQTRYLEIVKRRTRVEFIKEFLLIPYDLLKNLKNIVIVDINGVIVDINLKNADIGTQRKEEERKEEKSKGKESKEEKIKEIDNHFSQIAKIYQEVIGPANSFTIDFININLEMYGFEWFKNALLEANKRNKRNEKYVEGILQNWKNEGGMKLGGEGSGTYRGNNEEGLGQYEGLGFSFEDVQKMQFEEGDDN